MTQGAVDVILTLVMVMATGFALKKFSVMNKASDEFIPRLLQKAGIPALMLHTVLTQFTPGFLLENQVVILAAFLTILASIIVALLTARLFRIAPANQGIFSVMFAFSNTIFIGVPVITGIFGDKGIPYLMLYYLANTFLFWTIGIWLIGGDAGARLLSMESVRKILSPPILTFFLGMFMIFNGISLPAPVLDGLAWMKSLVTPLSTLYMGSVIADISLRKLPGLKPTLLILLGRFAVSPLLAMAILSFFGFSGAGVPVIIIASALPVMMQVSVMAGYYGKDRQYSAFLTALTTILSIFVLPFWLAIR